MIPLEHSMVCEMEGVIAIARGPLSLFGYLTESAVTVRDAGSLRQRVVAEFARTKESVDELGPNHWIQWVKRGVLVFGTRDGKCFVCVVKGDGVELKKTVDLQVAITGTFACHGVLGVCASDSQILFVNEDGDVQMSYKFEFGGAGFRHPKFYAPFSLLMIADNKPFSVAIPKAPKRKPNKQKPLTMTFFSIDNPTLLAFNTTNGLLAAAIDNGSVVLTRSQCPNSDPALVVGARGDPSMVDDVVFLQWIMNEQFLCVVQRSGQTCLFDLNTRCVYRTAIAQLSKAQHIAFHDETRCLVYTSSEGINRIEFANVHQCCAFTCCSVYDYGKSADIFKIGQREELFPLLDAVLFDNKLFVQSNTCVASVVNGEIVATLKADIKKMIRFREYILVCVAQDNEYKVNVCNFALEVLSSIPISHSVRTITTNDNHVVISCYSRYSILTFYTSAPEKVDYLTVIPHRLFVEITVKTPRAQIKNAICSRDHGIILHTWDGAVVEHQFRKFREANVNYVICTDEPNMLIMQQDTGFKIICNYLSYTFEKSSCLFATPCAAFALAKEFTFGEIQFESKGIAPYMILSQNIEEWPEIIPFYNQFDIKSIFTQCIDLTTFKEDAAKITALMDYLCTHYAPEFVAGVFEAALENFQQHQRNIFFRCFFDWSFFFNALKDQLKKYVLMYVSPRNFETLVVSIPECPYFQNARHVTGFIQEAIKVHRFIRAFQFAFQTNTDFVAVAKDLHPFNSTNLSDLLSLFDKDSSRWNTDDDHFSFRMMGTTFERAHHPLVALAVFIVIAEIPKVSAILLVNQPLKDAASEFAKSNPNSPHAVTIVNSLT